MARFLLDFSNDIAVVFYEYKGKQYCSSFYSRYDLWEFLQNAPKEIAARAATSAIRAKARDIAAKENVSFHEAAELLAAMPEKEVKFISKLGGRATSQGNFDISKIEF